jgi:polar amino acid transport system permease protein
VTADGRPAGSASLGPSDRWRQAPEESRLEPKALAVLALGTASLFIPLVPGLAAIGLVDGARRRVRGSHGRRTGDRLIGIGQRLALVGLALWAVGLTVLLVVRREDIGGSLFFRTYLNRRFLVESFPSVRRGFFLNVKLMLAAEAMVLVWALVVALLRLAPGRAGAPVRFLAVAYIDIFRGLPALLTIYLVGFGAPIAGVPWLGHQSLFIRGAVAITLVYGAYVAEVYRAGIESIHPSQAAAARSLGLSGPQAMRFVVLPQAVRRVVPPLLNDFIGLQKDTALVNVIGLVEGFRSAATYAGTRFNPSSMVGLGLCFIAVTVPLTRLTDYLLRRDSARTRA